jgi:hypothetical protein
MYCDALDDDVWFDTEVDEAADELAPDTDPCPDTVRSTPHPPVINVSNPTPVETVLIQSLDLALTELSECRLENQQMRADLVMMANTLDEAKNMIAVLRDANENLYLAFVQQKARYQTVLANSQVPSHPEIPS